MTPTATLDPAGRDRALAEMARAELDILVIGGGVVGAGAALDAATRGVRVGLVEARDYASGTSSRSSKLIHGGLRYLEQLDFGLVREALRERSLILNRLAPHLAHAVPFLYPLRHRVWERFYVGSGVLLYDTMGGRHGVPTHRHLTRRQALAEFPSLRKDALVGAIKYYDGQIDDARHTVMLARTAARHGALCANSARVTSFLREGDRVVGAVVRDLETGADLEVRARQVINAAGVWTDEIQDLVGGRGQFHVHASKGIHLLVPRDRIHARTGIISRTETSVLFIIPWDSHWIIGTTDTDWALDLAHPAASQRDIDYLIDNANRLLVTPLTREDVVGVYAGLRPLLAGESESTSQLSREHAVVSPVAGLVVVAGGKYTTYRVMAKDAVDAALHDLPGAAWHVALLNDGANARIACVDTGLTLFATGRDAEGYLVGPEFGFNYARVGSQWRMLRERGIPMVYGVYEPEHLRHAMYYVNAGMSTPGSMWDFYLIGDYGLTAMEPIGTNGMKPSLESLYYYLWMIEEAQVRHPWYISIWGQGALDDTAILRRAIELGGHIKTGLELFYDPARNPTNLELLQQAQEIAQDVGRPIATHDEARALYKLK